MSRRPPCRTRAHLAALHQLPRVTTIVLLFLLVDHLAPARARADACEAEQQTVDQIQKAALAGSRLVHALEASDAQVALVGRIGTDQTKRGIRYTHVGLSLRDHPQGPWHFVHLLNDCGTARSSLFDDGPMNFFLERPFSYDAWIVIPTRSVQQALLALLESGIDHTIHHPSYSAIAHPFKVRHQNSNQWVLELLGLAFDRDAERTRLGAQAALQRLGYEPARIKLGFFERIGARRKKNVKLREHRLGELRSGGAPYVSVRSIVQFLERQSAISESFEIGHESGQQRPMTAAVARKNVRTTH